VLFAKSGLFVGYATRRGGAPERKGPQKGQQEQGGDVVQRAGFGLDKIRAHSRHRSIATLMLYVDEHDRQRTQTTLADLVASTLTS
jgi:hypothetical protein